MVRYLREREVAVKWFHRWSWRRPLRYNRRNHRKLLVVDDRIAYVGGFNIHRESSRQLYGDTRWRDTHVVISGAHLISNHNRGCRHLIRCLFSDAFAAAAGGHRLDDAPVALMIDLYQQCVTRMCDHSQRTAVEDPLKDLQGASPKEVSGLGNLGLTFE